MADGTVTIETKLDNSGAEKGLNDLKKEVESSSKSTAQEIDKASDQAQKSVEEVAKSAEKTGKQVEKSAKDSASKAGQAAKQGADSAAKGTESASTKMQQSHKKVKDTAKESADGAKKSWEESNQSTVASTESATSKMAGLMKKSAAVIGVASVAAAKKTIDVLCYRVSYSTKIYGYGRVENKSDGFWIVRCHELSCSIWRRPWNSIRHCNGLNDRFRIESKGFWTFCRCTG